MNDISGWEGQSINLQFFITQTVNPLKLQCTVWVRYSLLIQRSFGIVIGTIPNTIRFPKYQSLYNRYCNWVFVVVVVTAGRIWPSCSPYSAACVLAVLLNDKPKDMALYSLHMVIHQLLSTYYWLIIFVLSLCHPSLAAKYEAVIIRINVPSQD